MLVWLDGFDDLVPILTKYTGTLSGSLQSTGGRVNGAAFLRLVGGNTTHDTITKSLPTSDSFAVLGFGFRAATLAGGDIAALQEGATVHLTVQQTGTTLAVTRNGTVLGTAATGLLANATWYYIELKATISDTVGAVELRVNGAVVLSLTGIDTRNGGVGVVDTVSFIGKQQIAAPNYDFDDWYLVLGTSGQHADYLGDIVVDAFVPDQQGFYAQGVGSDGNSIENFTLVNEATPDTTTYVDLQSTGNAESYSVDTPFSSVVGVMIQTYADKNDAGARTLQQIVRIGGTDYNAGSPFALSAGSFTLQQTVLDANPATSGAWTVTAFNAAEFGAKAA